MAAISRQYFEMYFLEWKCMNFYSNFNEVCPINNIPSLVLIMAWRRPGDKPLFEPMLFRSLTHVCVTRPQWVNDWLHFQTPTQFIHSHVSCNLWLRTDSLISPVLEHVSAYKFVIMEQLVGIYWKHFETGLPVFNLNYTVFIILFRISLKKPKYPIF